MITRWQRIRITAVMAIAFTEEHADAMLLSAIYLAISRSLDSTVSQLGTLSMWQALVQVSRTLPSETVQLGRVQQVGFSHDDCQLCSCDKTL